MLLPGLVDDPNCPIPVVQQPNTDRLSNLDSDFLPQSNLHGAANRNGVYAYPVFDSHGDPHRIHDLDPFAHAFAHRNAPPASDRYPCADLHAVSAAFQHAHPGTSHGYTAARHDPTLSHAHSLSWAVQERAR